MAAREPEPPQELTPPVQMLEELSLLSPEERGHTPRPSKSTMLFISGMSACSKKHWEEAFKKLAQSVQEAEREPTHKEPHAISLMGLGYLCACNHQWDKAELCYTKSIHLWDSIHSPDSPKLARLLGDISAVFEKQGKNAEALQYAQRAFVSAAKGKGANSVEVQAIVCGIASLHNLLKQFDEAEKQYKSAVEHLRASGHPSLAMALKLLHGFLLSQNKTAEAQAVEAELKEVAQKHHLRV